ncbi:MAG TPA: type II toxin-antitoxin system VapC family toxin [Spirochaetota bacterium]
MHLADTNICIDIINKKPIELLNKLKRKSAKDIFISAITVAELEHGVKKSNFPQRNKIALVEFLSLFRILYSIPSQYHRREPVDGSIRSMRDSIEQEADKRSL